jgi:phosphoribosyl 1,2-cyclic phosphodiesterase
MRFASLGSGSEGNALVVESQKTRILLDCGFSATETERRLLQKGLKPQDIQGILVTHEHDDHVGGVARFAKKHSIPVYSSYGTYQASAGLMRIVATASDIVMNIIDAHTSFNIGDLEITPYPVPHDAREPTQFVFSDGARRLGVLTDVGGSTPHIEQVLSSLSGLVLECNHDRQLLDASQYPEYLKERIGGRYGHLDNHQAAQILRAVYHDKLQHVVAAHLSQKNNRPDLAASVLAQAIGCEEQWIGIATQVDGFDWRVLY